MSETITYYMTSISPWTYFGGHLLPTMAANAGADIDILPANLGEVFAVTGGLPLGQRSQARQDYRMVEMIRWRDYHGLTATMNVEPKFFPTNPSLADRTIIAAKKAGADAVALSNAVMACAWEKDLNIAEADVLRDTCNGLGLDGDALVGAADGDAAIAQYAANTQSAIEAGMFGAPWYIYKGEPFWGQDRLPLLQAALDKG
jgi:2-hydroxychromene-2-carboxylate isomerase